jgi:hypothetical protein
LDIRQKSNRKCFLPANKTSEAFVFDLAILKSYYKAWLPLPEAEKTIWVSLNQTKYRSVPGIQLQKTIKLEIYRLNYHSPI